MKPVKTEHTEAIITLPGGTEENDLPAYAADVEGGGQVICSVWLLNDEERARIAAGENVRLCVHFPRMVPVSIDLTDEKILS